MKYLKNNVISIRLDDYLNQKVNRFTDSVGGKKSVVVEKLVALALYVLDLSANYAQNYSFTNFVYNNTKGGKNGEEAN